MRSTFDLELSLDRLAGRFAAELPPHLASAAVAYASDHASPSAPVFTSSEISAVRAALDEPELRVRALDLARVVAPTAIEATPAVASACSAERTWANWRALRTARDAAAHALFGRPHLALLHDLARADVTVSERVPDSVAPPDPAWSEPSGLALSDAEIQSLWRSLATRDHGALTILRGRAHPRLFAIERGVRATVVLPTTIASPASRFAVLHELGHALLWLAPDARTREWPRAIDEAAAAYVTRAMEQPISVWWEPRAADARARRTELAKLLASAETNGVDVGVRPPWALWHDPAAQASYVRAEEIVESLPQGLRGDQLVTALAAI